MKKIFFLLIIGIGLAACGGGNNAQVETRDLEATQVQAQLETLQTEIAAVQPTQTISQGEPTQETAALPTATEVVVEGIPLGFPLGDAQLKATDPNTVSLSKGEPQVVEYFAFW